MGKYTNLPTFDVDYQFLTEMSFSVEGAGIDGGRNGDGDSPAIDFSGGGKIVGSYSVFAAEPEQHEMLNQLAARLNGSTRYIVVPILTDRVGPFPLLGKYEPQPIISGIPHSDGALFGDGAGYSQATVFGTFEKAAALNAGQITVNIFGAARNLRWADWMSTYHATRGWRAWRYWEANDPIPVTRTVEGVTYTGQQYELAISPPLREAVTAGQRIELARPRFVARFPRGFNLPWQVTAPFNCQVTVNFVEAEVR